MDDEDVAMGHALHGLAHAVSEQALHLTRLPRADDDEIRLTADPDLDDRLRDLSDRLDELGFVPQLAESGVGLLELQPRSR